MTRQRKPVRNKGSGSVYQRKSDGRWVGSIEAGWTSKGTRRRITVSALTKREALRKLKARERELVLHGPPPEQQSGTLTVKAFADQWLQDQAERVSPSTYIATRTAVTQWVIPTIGHRRLSQITARDVRTITKAIVDAGRATSTVSRYQAVLLGMLKDAARDGYSVTQSALLAEGVPVGRVDSTAIPHDDVARILEAAKHVPDYSRWLAAFLAGLRPAEARGLTWDRVTLDGPLPALEISWQLKALPYNTPRDRDSGFRVPTGYESQHLKNSWHLVRPKTVAGDRWIPMHTALQAALRDWQNQCPTPSGLVWPALVGRAAGGPRNDKLDRATWKSLLQDAGVADFDMYAARHTTASLLKAQGVADEVIVAIMGHTSIRSTQAYIHTRLEDAAKELERATQALQLPS